MIQTMATVDDEARLLDALSRILSNERRPWHRRKIYNVPVSKAVAPCP